YLLDAYRYKKMSKSDYDDSIIFKNVSSTNDFYEYFRVDSEDSSASRKRLSIPGDLFIVNGNNILNINLTYIPSKEKELRKKVKEQNRLRILTYSLTAITFAFIALHLFSG